MSNLWRHVNEIGCNGPPQDQYILVARPSGYRSTDWELISAKLTVNGWVDVGNDALLDSGAEPLYYQPEPDAPGCASCLECLGKPGGTVAPTCKSAGGQTIPEAVYIVGCEHYLGDIPF